MQELDKEYEIIEQNDEDLLNALLGTEDTVTKQIFMPRFKSYFTIKSISSDDYARLEERCKYPVKNKRTHQIEEKVDQEKLTLMIINEACVKPNWSDPKLLQKYQTNDPCTVIKKRLLIGEQSTLSGSILDISGFNDDIETIKNS